MNTDDARLLVVLRWIVNFIQRSDGLAFELMMVLASVTCIPVLPIDVFFIYAHICDKDANLSSIRLNQAIEMLGRFSLFDIASCPRSEPPFGMVMHSLIRYL